MGKAFERLSGSRGFAEVGFVVAWSSGFVGAELGTRVAGTSTLMAWRFALAACLLFAAVALLRRDRPTFGELVFQGLVGFLAQGVYLAGVIWAVELGVAAGTAALVAALQPMLASALAGPALGERVSGRQWWGLVVGLAGVVLVVGGDARLGGVAPAWAYALPFLGMAGLVAATLLQKGADTRRDAGAWREMPLDVALAIQCAVSAVLFGAVAFVGGDLAPVGGAAFWGAVLWFVVLSTFGGYGFYWLALRRGGVARVSALIYLTPPTTMVWAWLMFGDAIGSLAVLGLGICLCGVLLAGREPQQTETTPLPARD